MATTSNITERPATRSRFSEHPLLALREELDDVFGRMFGPSEDGVFWGKLSPQLDVSETDGTVEVRMDIPGVQAKELDIRISNNRLTISGERKEEKEEKGRTYYRSERRSGSFSRSITLPCSVDEKKIEAKCSDGVLTITLPKAAAAKAHKIEVKT